MQAEAYNYYSNQSWKKWTCYWKVLSMCSQRKYHVPAYLQNGQSIKIQNQDQLSPLLF